MERLGLGLALSLVSLLAGCGLGMREIQGGKPPELPACAEGYSAIHALLSDRWEDEEGRTNIELNELDSQDLLPTDTTPVRAVLSNPDHAARFSQLRKGSVVRVCGNPDGFHFSVGPEDSSALVVAEQVACELIAPRAAATPTPAVVATSAPKGVPLTAIPALNSRPGARATLYLNFTGYSTPRWGGYSNVSVPPLDMDGDPTTFSPAEISVIRQTWAYVTEDYAPFNINITTVKPDRLIPGVSMQVVIGGTSAWTGGKYGGIAYIGAFVRGGSTDSTAWVFAQTDYNNPRYMGDAISHEAGHSFGLSHQRQFNNQGALVAEYYPGTGDGRAPIMGYSYVSTRAIWWYGTTQTPTTMQNDMAVIAGTTNGFGYMPSSQNSAATAHHLWANSTGALTANGLVAGMSEKHYYSFTSGPGQLQIASQVMPKIMDLAAKLELWAVGGSAPLAVADVNAGLGAQITATLTGGNYLLVVKSHGGYGDVGRYTLSGKVTAK